MKDFYKLSRQIEILDIRLEINKNTTLNDIKHYIKIEREAMWFYIKFLKNKEGREAYLPLALRKFKIIILLKKIKPMIKENEKNNKENEIKRQISIEKNKKQIKSKLNNGYIKTYEDNDYVVLDKLKNGRRDKIVVYKIN